jgi:hypothetical protein
MFGGVKTGGALDDTTWKRSGSTWTSSHPIPSPSPRVELGFAYDVARAQIVLFGGAVASGLSNETWIFDGTTWSQRTPAHSPQPRAAGAMAYDAVNNLVVMFGGDSTVGFTDLWAWDGTDWTDITPTGDSPPPTLNIRTLTSNPFRHSLLLLGATASPVFETWELQLAPGTWSWSQVRTLTTPATPRVNHGAFLLPDQFTTVVAGGASTTVLADQWAFRLDGPRGHEACQLPIDVDGDGATLCADPDCWPVCSPTCPPATSCPSMAPRCGDGICDAAFETCHNCPADCTSCAPVCGDHACDSGETTTCPGDCP